MLARGQTLIITVQDVIDEEETSFNKICQPDQHHTECDSPKIKRKVGSEVKKKKSYRVLLLNRQPGMISGQGDSDPILLHSQ